MMKIIYFKDKDFDGSNVGIYKQKDGSFLAMTFTIKKAGNNDR